MKNIFSALLVLCFPAVVFSQRSERPPNIVFFLVDDMGWTDVEPFGTDFFETPNITRLANEGMKFTRAYAACPVCSPTRASILTGKFPVAMRTTDWFGAPQPTDPPKQVDKNKPNAFLTAAYREYLPLEETTIAEALKKAGYTTMLAGKWHLGSKDMYAPDEQGFDVIFGGAAGVGGKGGYFAPYKKGQRNISGPEGEYIIDRLAEETAGFIEKNKEHPFFAFFSFYSVHTPLEAPENLVKKYTKKLDSLKAKGIQPKHDNPVYAGMVECTDRAVGKVLDKLKELNLEENTLVVFFSDNGGLLGKKNSPTSNLPLRSGKGWMYEGGIRVPMIVKMPGTVEPGSETKSAIISTDFYPTLLEVAGLPLMPKQHTDGKSILPLLNGGKEVQRRFFWHYPHYHGSGAHPGSAVMDGDWKLIHYYTGDRYELYDLKNDLGEKKDLAAQQPDRVKKMKTMLEEWLKKNDANMPEPVKNNKP